MAVPCLIACVAWCKRLLGAFQSRTPMHNNDNNEASLIFIHTEPFSPTDHMGPQPIVKVEVQEDVIPPAMVCSHLILPLLANPMEGSLGDLQLLVSISIKKKQRERLPQLLLDNVPIQTTGYTLRC